MSLVSYFNAFTCKVLQSRFVIKKTTFGQLFAQLKHSGEIAIQKKGIFEPYIEVAFGPYSSGSRPILTVKTCLEEKKSYGEIDSWISKCFGDKKEVISEPNTIYLWSGYDVCILTVNLYGKTDLISLLGEEKGNAIWEDRGNYYLVHSRDQLKPEPKAYDLAAISVILVKYMNDPEQVFVENHIISSIRNVKPDATSFSKELFSQI
jgi:hypothetical protein